MAAKRSGESTRDIRSRVVNARKIQTERFASNGGIYCNADMSAKEIRQFCQIDHAGADLLKTAMDRLGLSARAYDRILKVARTIADLARVEDIGPEHLGEAIQYRSLDRSYYAT